MQSDEAADKDAYEAAAKELTNVMMPIGAKLYEQVAGTEAAEGEAAKADGEEPVEGEVINEEKDK